MEKLINILLVEDDNLDVIAIKRALDKMNLLYHMHVSHNGEEALAYLHEKKQSGAASPDITLIDINMPKMNGLEFLQAIRRSDDYKNMKCFMITTSDEKVDKDTAKKLGISGYIIKPLKLNNPASMDSFNLMIDLMNMRTA